MEDEKLVVSVQGLINANESMNKILEQLREKQKIHWDSVLCMCDNCGNK